MPLVDTRVVSGTGRNVRTSLNLKEHDEGITAKPGEIIRVLVWFHNSGSENKRTDTTARDVRVGSAFDEKASVRHSIAVLISAENAETIHSSDHGGDAIVNTPAPTVLEYLPNSTELCLQVADALEKGIPITQSCGDYPEGKERYGAKVQDGSTNTPANGSVRVGDLKAGNDYTRFLRFHLKVVEQGASK